MKTLEYDVLIIGYGPVGKLVSGLLGKKGWNVGVFEKFDKPYGLPRAIKYDHEITRNIQAIAPVEEIQKVSVKVPDQYVWCNGEGKTLLEIDWSQDGISGWPADMLFNQAELENVMDEASKSYPTVDVHLGYQGIYINEKEDDVSVLFKTKDGEVVSAKAKYVIGCDGANSFVRENMEHSITDLGFYNDFLVVDIIPKEEMNFEPMNLQICDPKRPTTRVSGGPGRRRWEFMLLPGETKEEFQKEEVCWELLKPWNITPENAILERYTVYTFKAKWVNEWRKNRLMLAGDAAHLTPPFMGQGLSSGIRDASNIAWKLDLVLQGISDDTLLDTYTEERKPHMIKLIEAAIYLGKMICTTDEEEAKRRDEAFLSGNFPPFPEFPILTDGILYQAGENHLAGQLSLQSVVSYQGQTDLYDNVIGHGWMVMGWNKDPKQYLSEEQIQFMDKIGGKFVHLTDVQGSSKKVVDVEGKYEKYFKDNQVDILVVRPDFNIFAGVSQEEELAKVIDCLEATINSRVGTVETA
ncbi:bifunctional 3-(3-hydroxy-phenyl)propionate/3-hydroxycinnamic acid hydroxylase [Oceanobacillus halophilus]|uniref:Bifunctional 3-(3-hydroxy-phenyl)propionate/3-hydroxycinnamic acid hydroxylase n=1 Tax=Oceanobacillus halophilus TaxID=930130 RepID=A0A494ZV90_9BACI|nr:bifunctional 3-(3-hydroxy-phenyl)propionate/3-hydroxycinnamic acid hydroxylase [Oceanobacillus halophilus]RKQ30378.1 bifunctional 3-(3-hydroxy-phenyl)propionate/3-hydroxycinnamic acid hydroxylase [Oceanobacillus halophilus]